MPPETSPTPDTPRSKPYVWVSWLTKLLAGEASCWYASWYKARHKYAKQEDPERGDFLKDWTVRHDALTAEVVADLKADGYVVRVEQEGEFTLRGRGADLAGKPDVVGLRENRAVVKDAKAGKERESDHWQVRVYMFALPVSWLEGPFELSGFVVYRSHEEAVQFTPAHQSAIIEAIRKISSPEAPEASPSPSECLRCDIAACTFRTQGPRSDATRFF